MTTQTLIPAEPKTKGAAWRINCHYRNCRHGYADRPIEPPKALVREQGAVGFFHIYKVGGLELEIYTTHPAPMFFCSILCRDLWRRVFNLRTTCSPEYVSWQERDLNRSDWTPDGNRGFEYVTRGGRTQK